MPSSLHEALVSFFRARPLLAAELLAVAQGLAPLGGVEGVVIDTDLSEAVPAEYRAEPVLALAGGADGMDFIRRLLQDAPACMTEHAVLVLEIGNERDFFEAAFPQLPVFWLDTSAGGDQVLLVTRGALQRFV